MSGFSNGGSNIWDRTGVSTQPNIVLFSGTVGTLVSSRLAITAAGDWYWTGGTLSVYGTSNPSGTIEAGQRNYGISTNGQSYLTISGLNVYGVNGGSTNGGGIQVGNLSNYVTISNNTVQKNYDYDIFAGQTNYLTVSNNTLGETTGTRVEGDAIYVGGEVGGGCVAASTNLTVSGNTISGSIGRMGIAVVYVNGGTVAGNTVTYNGTLSAIDMEPDTGCSVQNVTVSSNTITIANTSAVAAVTATNDEGGTLSNLTISSNTIAIANDAASGVIFSGPTGTNLISGNTITGLGNGDGLYLVNATVTAQQNSISATTGTGLGIVFQSTSSSTPLTASVLNNYINVIGGGIWSYGGGAITASIQGNELVSYSPGTTGWGIDAQNSNSSTTLNISANIVYGWFDDIDVGYNSTAGTYNIYNNTLYPAASPPPPNAATGLTGTVH
jgi:parallel beta-helix repeat protein